MTQAGAGTPVPVANFITGMPIGGKYAVVTQLGECKTRVQD